MLTREAIQSFWYWIRTLFGRSFSCRLGFHEWVYLASSETRPTTRQCFRCNIRQLAIYNFRKQQWGGGKRIRTEG